MFMEIIPFETTNKINPDNKTWKISLYYYTSQLERNIQRIIDKLTITKYKT